MATAEDLREALQALTNLAVLWLEDRECTGSEWMGLEDLRARGGVPKEIIEAERLLEQGREWP